jgi:hypothetical protein
MIEETESLPKPDPKLLRLVWPLSALFAFCVVCVCASAVYLGSRAADLTGAFLRGDVSESFSSYTQSVKGASQLVLCVSKRTVVAKMLVPTLFSHSEATILTPVEYSYYVDMKGKWTLTAEDGVLRVTAPALEIKTPAVDLAGMMVVVDRSVFDFGRSQAKLDELKAQALPILRKRGMTPEALKEVRETARAELADFISAWSGAARKGRVDCILIRFADEAEFPATGFSKPRL